MTTKLPAMVKELLSRQHFYPITKQVQVYAIQYLRNFFANKNINAKSISKDTFFADGFDPYFPIIIAYVLDMFPDNVLRSTHIAATSNSTITSCDQATSDISKDKIDNTDPFSAAINNSKIKTTYENVKRLFYTVMQWDDTFNDCKRRVVAACDYILTNLVNKDLVNTDLVTRKLETINEFFNLDKNARELMKFCYTFRATGIKLPRDVQNFTDRMRQISELTGVDIKEIEAFATINKTQNMFYPFIIETISVQDNVWQFISNERINNLEECFYTILNSADSLPRNFFDVIDTENTDLILKLIKGNESIKRPRNILLYGKPGTGKTSYMKLISKLSGRKAYVITQATPSDNIGRSSEYDTSVESRFMSITVCDERVDSKKSIIVVDEADEMINCRNMMFADFVFGGDQKYDTHIKSLLNQVMDGVETPVIWITNNDPMAIDPSCRRRFDYSVCFDEFNAAQRKLIWQNNVKRFNLSKLITPSMIDELASEYAITPGGIATACQDLVDIAPTKKDVRATLDKVLQHYCDLLCIKSQQQINEKFRPVANYELNGLNIESSIPIIDVQDICQKYLAKKMAGKADRSLCILLSGPSGTGKTEFCKYLGSVLKKDVHVVRGSTVLDKYVGETERKIAHEFRAAENADTILFMDELDGLLGGRERTQHSWEVSQVNEILQQMENFRGIFIAATNFSDNLDNASIRRFAFKFKFDYLKEDGIIAFYKRYFGKLDSKNAFYSKLKNMRMISPGDFALVHMLSEYTKDKITPEWVYEALKREVNSKKSNSGLNQVAPKNIGY